VRWRIDASAAPATSVCRSPRCFRSPGRYGLNPPSPHNAGPMVISYGASPSRDIGWAYYAPAMAASSAPLGPATVTPSGKERHEGLGEASWCELRSATGIIIRALVLKLETGDGRPASASPSPARRFERGAHGPLPWSGCALPHATPSPSAPDWSGRGTDTTVSQQSQPPAKGAEAS
jgi:hypothetical protein